MNVRHALIAFLCFIPSFAFAGSPTSCNLHGQITSSASGTPLRAYVRLTDERTGWERIKRTHANGRFSFAGIRADGGGNQRLDVAADRYATRSFVGVRCSLGTTANARIALDEVK